ncbi:cytochrome c oxidase assembly factor 1 homolog [Saccoglossus kowalevskii]|uniref:Uncharacterized protein LOC102808335 n=1 Tax=Saccoglossus kowalevskii TaxID=10224 RepID=A0ABM0M3I0_SACKO|nr:PREDICTED: uncharacterized protein LOC102808335 [Saccoglossus kowalevskii]
MRLPSMSTLQKIAIYGGILSLGGSGIMYTKIQDNLVSGSYYRKSMIILSEHKQSVEMLGAPIKSRYLDLGDKFNRVNGLSCTMKIPVKGRKSNGTLYSWAMRNSPDKDWDILKLQLQLENSSKIITIYPKTEKELDK